MKHIMPVKEDIDPTLKAYFKVGEEIMPPSVEELYVKLANLVSDYFEYYSMLNKKQIDYDSSFNIIASYSTKILTLKSKILVLEEQIKALVKGQMTSDDVYQLHRITSQLYPLKRNLEGIKRQDDNNKRVISNKNDEISSIHFILTNIIKAIRDILKEILDLDINGVRRLDRIIMTKKHVAEINGIFGESANDYARIFTSYMQAVTNAKLASFKFIESIAEKIISLYNHNVLGDGFSADELSKYKIADHLLTSASEDVLINSPEPSDIDKLQSEDIPILNESTKYLTSGLVNPELIERYKTAVIGHNNRMLLKSLETAVVKDFKY